jgi:hypothetical protein
MNSPHLQRRIPFDLTAIGDLSDWSGRLVWPVSHAEQYDVHRRQFEGLIQHIGGIDDGMVRDVLMLGTIPLMSVVRFLTDIAIVVGNGKFSGIELAGNLPELAFLQGKTGAEDIPLPPMASCEVPDKAWLRRLVRTASWTPWRHLGKTFAAPTSIVITHNSLLREAARESSDRLVFHQAESWLAKARAQNLGDGFNTDVMALAESLADVLATCSGLNDPWNGRLRTLILPWAQNLLRQASRDIEALRRMDDLPMTIWSGSGSYYPTRAMSLAVMRRGGTVKGFEHGGCMGFGEDNLMIAFGEFASVTEYMFCTQEKADFPGLAETVDLIKPLRRMKISGLHGDPEFRFSGTHRKLNGRRPKVVYVPTTLLGLRQLYPPLLSDVVALDWQLRVAEFLSRLPINFSCRPHPEGFYPWDSHPLADVAPLSGGPFRQVMDEADLFVYDFFRTSSLWECLCTDKPVVFLGISLGHEPFAPEVQALMEERCRFVDVVFDENNVPRFDGEMLAQAVMDDLGPADSSAIRRVQAGQYEPERL